MPAGGLVARDEARLPIGGDDVAAVLPDQLGPEVLHVGRLGVEAPLARRCHRLPVTVSCLADLGELRPVPRIVGVGDPGCVEHRLVVVEGDDVEVARQAELAVRAW